MTKTKCTRCYKEKDDCIIDLFGDQKYKCRDCMNYLDSARYCAEHGIPF